MRLTTTVILLLTLFVSYTGAADVSWQDVTIVTGPESIITEGPLVSAVSASNSAVNHDVAGITFSSVDGLLASSTGDASFGGTVGDPEFDFVLNSHTWQGGGGSFEIDGLTPGNEYALQIFGVYDTRDCCGTRDTIFSDGRGPDFGSGAVIRGNGEAVVGLFTADAATQTIEVLPGEINGVDPGFSAYVLRQVPEPAGISLAVFALLGFLTQRRK